MTRSLALFAIVAAACGGKPAAAPTPPPVTESPAPRPDGTADLRALADEYWAFVLRENPTWATALGVKEYDDRLEDISPDGLERQRQTTRALLERVRAIDPGSLDRAGRITQAMLVSELDSALAMAACRNELWRIDHLNGPQVDLFDLGDLQGVESAGDEAKYVARLEAFGPHMDQHIANLRAGLAEGLIAPRMNVERSLAQLVAIPKTPLKQDPLMRQARHDPARVQRAIEDVVRPAFARYHAFLRKEVLPEARAEVGVGALHLGEACYRAAIVNYTSRDTAPRELHELGLAEMERIRAEMEVIARRLFPKKSLDQVLASLRESPKHAFATREQVETAAREAVERAEAKLPEAFSLLPEAPVEVRRLEPYAEKDAPMAYYRQPAPDGTRPGVYFVNTYLPQKRPRYTAEVLAFHEAVPGHHLQIAIGQEIDGVPEFQKHVGTTAFFEGWALYTERLCDEMGLYSGDLDRLGMLSFDAWRAARLVVDTGMHSLGWTRKQAIDYMLKNTASTRPDIENEVDRYITWPGQALAYKVGQLEILAQRARAREALGERFDLKEFHRRVLRNGAVTLAVLEDEIGQWIAEADE